MRSIVDLLQENAVLRAGYVPAWPRPGPAWPARRPPTIINTDNPSEIKERYEMVFCEEGGDMISDNDASLLRETKTATLREQGTQ